MRILLLIGTGGFIGSVARYLLGTWVQGRAGVLAFPTGTLAVNIVGCLVIGCLFGLGEKSSISPEWRLFAITGLCGGFTTFSAFSLETVNLLRSGQHMYALTYVALSLLVCLLATYVGFILFK